MKTPFINYQDGGAVCFVAGVSELIAGKEFVDWYSANNLQSYRMSPDEKFILVRVKKLYKLLSAIWHIQPKILYLAHFDPLIIETDHLD